MYQYTALRDRSHVRILAVHPSATFDGPVICSIEEVALEEESDYTALSYSWATEDGDATPNCNIVIEDVQHAVTQNLFEASRRLRRSKEPVRLWIDAVCINQQDDVERSSQVAMMGRIYETASRTVAWLGKTPITADNLSLGLVFEYAEKEAPTEGFMVYKAGESVPFFEDESTDALFRSMSLLLQRRYFTRRWIVQEIILGRNVTFRWNHHECPAAQFVAATNLSAARNHWMFRHDLNRLSNVDVNINSWLLLLTTPGEERPDLLELLELCNDMSCSDPRDRLYALLGLDPSSKIAPDYTKSLEEVYIDFAEALVLCGRARDLFMVLEETRSRYRYPAYSLPNTLPSWVPDLRTNVLCGSREIAFEEWTFDPQVQIQGSRLSYWPLA